MEKGGLVHIPQGTLFINSELKCFTLEKPVKAIYWGKTLGTFEPICLAYNHHSLVYYNNSFYHVRDENIYLLT